MEYQGDNPVSSHLSELTMGKPNILLADDHSITRRGLKLLFELYFGYPDMGEVSSCSELMKELSRKTFSHLVLDIILSDGSSLEVLPVIQKLYPDLRIMIFSMQPAGIYAKALRQYGIHHYVSKTIHEDETIKLLRRFLQNEPAPDHTDPSDQNNPFSDFTPRELEILHYMLKGTGTNEIASALNLKWNTISTVKNRIFEKTNTGNVIELKDLATLYKVN